MNLTILIKIKDSMRELIEQLYQSNEIGEETRDKLLMRLYNRKKSEVE